MKKLQLKELLNPLQEKGEKLQKLYQMMNMVGARMIYKDEKAWR